MSTEETDPAEAIAQALSRMRGRRPAGRGHGGPHGWQGGGLHGEFHGGPHGGSHGGPPEEHFERHGGRGGRPGMPPWMAEPGGRMAGPARMRMLEALAAASAPLSVSALGEAIGVDQPRASRLVQQGVERGYVRREADPEDARRTRIALTDEGRRIARGMRGERKELLGRALSSFTDEESRELARLLTKLADNWQG